MSGSKRKAAKAGLASPPAPSKKRVIFEPDALARAALIEHTTWEDAEAATKAQKAKWESMSGDEKRERTAKVVRYMLLSYGQVTREKLLQERHIVHGARTRPSRRQASCRLPTRFAVVATA